MTCEDLLYEALASEFGIEVSASDPELLRSRLYAARAKLSDAALESLSFTPGPPGHLWILKRPKANET